MQDGYGFRVGAQGRRDIRIGFACVDHGGAAGLRGHFELAVEDPALYIAGRMIVVVVEAHLAGRHDAPVLKDFTEPCIGFRIPETRVVGMEASGCRDPGMGRREFKCGGGSGGGFPYDNNMPDAGCPGAGNDFSSISLESAGRQMTVRVNQHSYATGWALRRVGREEDDLLLRVP